MLGLVDLRCYLNSADDMNEWVLLSAVLTIGVVLTECRGNLYGIWFGKTYIEAINK